MPKLNCRVELPEYFAGGWRIESPKDTVRFEEDFPEGSLKREKSLDVEGYSALIHVRKGGISI
jgi:hypothetical protein